QPGYDEAQGIPHDERGERLQRHRCHLTSVTTLIDTASDAPPIRIALRTPIRSKPTAMASPKRNPTPAQAPVQRIALPIAWSRKSAGLSRVAPARPAATGFSSGTNRALHRYPSRWVRKACSTQSTDV